LKKLNSVQELWSHCLFCPICRDITREVYVSVGPDDVFELSKFEKKDHILFLDCFFYTKKEEFKIKYEINCLNNSFKAIISSPNPSSRTITGASSAHFYFYINSDCRICNASYTNGADLEIDFLSKEIINIGIEREGIYLLNEKSKYHITLEHDNNRMQISKCFEDEDGGIVDDNKPFIFPMIKLDFSNPKKVINKIKTLLVFS
jgi:hypothetical protein